LTLVLDNAALSISSDPKQRPGQKFWDEL